jgi:hypothetical protein
MLRPTYMHRKSFQPLEVLSCVHRHYYNYLLHYVFLLSRGMQKEVPHPPPDLEEFTEAS